MPWLLNEDNALKQKLQGLKVNDANQPVGGRPVIVRYRQPETENAPLSFPAITIHHTGFDRDPSREHRGRIELNYVPEQFPAQDMEANVGRSGYFAEFPIPYNLNYEIQVITRNSQHDFQLAAAMQGFHYLPARFGYLAIPEDGTVRRLDIQGSFFSNDERDSHGKRLFTRYYAIQISTELVENPHTIDRVEQVLAGVDFRPEDFGE